MSALVLQASGGKKNLSWFHSRTIALMRSVATFRYQLWISKEAVERNVRINYSEVTLGWTWISPTLNSICLIVESCQIPLYSFNPLNSPASSAAFVEVDTSILRQRRRRKVGGWQKRKDSINFYVVDENCKN